MNAILILLGRILLSAIFAYTAFNHAMDLAGAQTYLSSRGIPLAGLFVVASIALRLVGVFCVVAGYRTKWGVGVLMLYLVFSTVIFYTPVLGVVALTPLLRNMGLMGGLLILAASGPGELAFKKN